MSETHPEHGPSAPAADRDRSLAASPEVGPMDGEPTQTFAHEFPSACGDDGSEPADSEPTVISSGEPLAPLSTWSALRPRDLGKLLEGRKLDHFQLEEFIGGGGMGAVFRARDTLLGRTVAVKVLAAGATGTEETQLRFRNEAQSAARLDHPNIARVHYVGEADGFKYIVFEYLEGRNLRDLVAEVGPLPLEDALNFSLQIAEALAHAWQRDIVHRDIKPSNVLATPEGQVKLVDMGLARLRDVATAVEDLTASGVTLGTFDYISPEQARDPRSADIRSDIYSLGCTLYFMLCARPPFQGGTAIQKLLMHQADEPPSPREYRPDLPPAIEQLLRRMLMKSPADRFQNPAELIAAIATVADELGIPVRPTTTVQLTVAGHHSNWLASSLPWLIPAALLLVCVFIIDYFDRSMPQVAPWSTYRNSRSRAAPPETPASVAAVAPGSDAPLAAAEGSATGGPEPGGQSPPTGAVGAGNGAAPPNRAEATDPNPTAQQSSMARAAAATPSPNERPLFLSPPWFADRMTRAAEWLRSMPVRQFVEAIDSEDRRDALANGADLPEAQDVFRNVTSRRTFSTLRDACSSARDGDVIEIAHNGAVRVDRTTLPIQIQQKGITIRGAAGTWPVLQVITNAELARAGGETKVFEVAEGALRLVGLELELRPHMPFDVPLTGWHVVELGLGAEAEIVRCWLTLHGHANADFDMRNHDDFIHVAGRTLFVSESSTTSVADEVHIKLEDVVVRGGDTLVSVHGEADVSVDVNNALIAVRGYLLDGPQRVAMDRGRVDLQMDHVTADLGQGGIRIRGSSRGDYFHADLQNCILAAATHGALVEHVVDKKPSTEELPLVWRGRRNIYSNWEFIFRRQVLNGVGAAWTFRDWEAFWISQTRGGETGSMSAAQMAPWRSPREADQPRVAFEPSDYRVDTADPDLQVFLEGGSALPGMIPDRLPPGRSSPAEPLGESGGKATDASSGARTTADRPAVNEWGDDSTASNQ